MLAKRKVTISHSNPTIANAKDVFKMVSINAAEALNLKVGVIKESYLADLIIIDLKKPTFKTSNKLIESFSVFVNGKIIMENRQVLTINEEKILSKIDKIASKFT